MILVRTCLFAALGGFLFGYDLGLIGGALLPIQRYFNMTGSMDLGLVVGAAKIGAAAGTFLGGAAMARYGRQRALAANSLAFTMGPLIMALATGPWMLVLGRLIVGLGIGVSAVVSPAYIAELAPAGSRGALVQLYEVMLCVGMLAAPLVDWALSGGDERSHAWRLMVGIPAVPGLLLAAAPLFLPESPRWLVMRNRLDEALHVLTAVLRGSERPGSWRQSWGWSSEYERLAPSAGSSGPRPGSLSPAEEAVVHEAEDELLLLWSSVEADRGAVLERRRQVWRARQQKRAAAAARPGRLGRWARSILLGRPRAPSLDPIPEETHSRTASYASSPSRPGTAPGSPAARWSWSSDGRSLPRGLSPASSLHAPLGSGPDPGPGLGTAGPRQGQGYGHGHSNGADAGPGPGPGSEQGLRHGLLTSAVGSGSSGGASEPEPGRRPGSPRAGSGAARSLFGSKVKGGGAGGGGRSEGGGAGAYAPLAGAASVTAGGRRGRDADAESGESSRLLPLPVSAEARAWGEEREEPASDPEPSAADLPGEEGSLLRTLTAMMYDIAGLAGGPEARALWLALGLAFFDQATASTAIINYGPTLMRRMQQAAAAAAAAAVAGGPPSVGPPASPALGVAGSAGLGEALTAGDLGPDGAGGGGWTGGDGGALLLSVAIGAAKAVGVVAALLMVDRFGRRPLLIAGSLTGAAALAGVAAAQAYDNAAAVGWALCAFTLTFSVSWAGLYWVVVSELFSMPAKSAGSSAATCLLFLTGGAGTDLVFLSLQDAMGHGSFVLFAVISLASGAYVWALLPETKGRQLTEVTAMLSSEGGRKGGGGAGAASEVGWVQLRERRR